jgi:glutamate synthase (NADPH/NADH) small chain
MATTVDDTRKTITYRKFKDGSSEWENLQSKIFEADHSHKCPTYVHRTPPCQGSCPAGEDIRGWLDIVRGIEKPTGEMSWQEYAFRRSTDANPFPSIMGRVCPAPCEDGCNRNALEDHVGINAVEQFIGDSGLKNKYAFTPAATQSGKKVAIIGGGPAGLAAAYQLRRRGHACTVFDDHAELGGMMRYGIPGYRTPRDVLDGEIQRILDMGVETRMKTRVGREVSLEEIEKEFDAVLWALIAASPCRCPGRMRRTVSPVWRSWQLSTKDACSWRAEKSSWWVVVTPPSTWPPWRAVWAISRSPTRRTVRRTWCLAILPTTCLPRWPATAPE